MAEPPTLPETVTPEQFFMELLPAGFALQQQQGDAPPSGNIRLQYNVTGAGGGSWQVSITDGKMTAAPGTGEAELALTLSVDDWRDAILGRHGADMLLVVPQRRPGQSDNSQRARQLKGTLGLELSRDGREPFRSEMCFNNAAAPRTVIKAKLADYVDIQRGKLNGQQAFMAGKLRAEGDMAFLMQVATLTA
jgi:putative sterol carrier protein